MIHPVLPTATFAQRRQQLLAQLPDEAVVILFAAQEALRNGDVHFPFRQNSYFWYLTGFPEPNAIALLRKKQGQAHYTLFNAPNNPELEIWQGKIIGQSAALADYGVDEAFPIGEAAMRLPNLLADCQQIYAILGVNQEEDAYVADLLRQVHQLTGRGGAAIEGLFDLRRVLDEMRMMKSLEEQALLHEAGRISAAGHRAAMLAARTGAYEYTVQAALEAEFRRHMGCHWAFASIVAAGKNACCLHYHDNHAPLKAGELMMVDAGAEYAGYAGDISRTFPINGKFSREQQALYEIVLHAQKHAIAHAKAGIRHLELHRQTSLILMQGILDLGIVEGDAQEMVESGAVKRFFPHGTGHWLGLDVHDVGVYKIDGESRIYRPNMAITIEPGLYLQANDMGIDEKWRGIGIRIEDDIIITEGEAEITTADVPKEIHDIELLLAERV